MFTEGINRERSGVIFYNPTPEETLSGHENQRFRHKWLQAQVASLDV